MRACFATHSRNWQRKKKKEKKTTFHVSANRTQLGPFVHCSSALSQFFIFYSDIFGIYHSALVYSDTVTAATWSEQYVSASIVCSLLQWPRTIHIQKKLRCRQRAIDSGRFEPPKWEVRKIVNHFQVAAWRWSSCRQAELATKRSAFCLARTRFGWTQKTVFVVGCLICLHRTASSIIRT